MFFVLLIVVCVLCLILRVLCKKQLILDPPVLDGWMPLIGHAYLALGDSKDMYNCINKVSKECLDKGGVITLYAGPRKIYGVADPEDSMTIVNSTLEKHYFYNFAKPLLGSGLLTADVPTWKRNRKLLNPAFNQQVLDSFVEVFNSQAVKLVEAFRHKLNKPFDHEIMLRENNLETICLTALGVDASDYSDLCRLYLPRLMAAIQAINDRMQKFWLHSDFLYNMTREKKTQDVELKNLCALSKSIIQQKKMQKRNVANGKKEQGKLKTAFMDLLLDLADENGCFSEDQVREETDTIIAGGHETIAGVLTLLLTILGSHEKVQGKAYDEIIQILGSSEKNVHKNDLSKLVYIEAVLNETLRLYPILPIMPRVIDKDIQLKKYTIKEGSDCFISIHGLHRHAIWGEDAEQFRPERWLDKDTLPDAKYYAAFGLGRRSCIGKTYAMMSMKIIIVHLLRRYNISSDIDKMVLKLNVMPRPEKGHFITLTTRSNY